jgi:predicted RNA binding protein YcfA (HicA-like mRNA interferase family)
MTKLPRAVKGKLLADRLTRLAYTKDRQTGSHLILEPPRPGMSPINVPQHKSIDTGLLSALLKRVAEQNGMSVSELRKKLEI